MRSSLFQLDLFYSDPQPANGSLEDICLLPNVPRQRVLSRYAQAPGNELSSGKFVHPESSAALVANTFGYFLANPLALPPLPHCSSLWSAPEVVDLEVTVHFPWLGGRHPCLDVVVLTDTTVFGIESKRFEPYRHNPVGQFSRIFWSNVWGDNMSGYLAARDATAGNANPFDHLDVAQLVKHALALKTLSSGYFPFKRRPALIYLYAEPHRWPDGTSVSARCHQKHFAELELFSSLVENNDVAFIHFSYRTLLDDWANAGGPDLIAHARHVYASFFGNETSKSVSCK